MCKGVVSGAAGAAAVLSGSRDWAEAAPLRVGQGAVTANDDEAEAAGREEGKVHRAALHGNQGRRAVHQAELQGRNGAVERKKKSSRE